ncbi:hypothetical protein AAVH_15738 [Aphelenchoides avenae]|nr:hypothetical protein AAVH_15738 [Aphelenchus avenae]
MSKRPHYSQAAASTPEDLVKRLKAAAGDAELLREVVESSDSVSISAAFAALLAGGTASAANGSELRKKAPNRPCRSLPAESFLEVVLFADRDTLDAMQLVCTFLLKFIRERELTQLALRAIHHVIIGKRQTSNDNYEGWLPTIDVYRGRGKELAAKTVHHLASCLRMAFCASVRLTVDAVADTDSAFDAVWSMVFEDLVAPSTLVCTLDIDLPLCRVELALRGIEAFKSVKNVKVHLRGTAARERPLDESFFVPAAERGVRHIQMYSMGWNDPEVRANTAAALSFGFAKPTTGGDRTLAGFDCGIGADFLAQVKQKASQLRVTGRVDFIFTIWASDSLHIDSTGFEKYEQDDGRTWLMNDLESHLNVEVKRIMNIVGRNFIVIRVFSPI